MSLVFNRDPLFEALFDSSLMAPWPGIGRDLSRVGGSRDPASMPGNMSMLFKPQIDVYDAGEAIKVHVELPGVPKENVRAELDKHGNLVVEGETSSDKEYEQYSARVRERRYGRFQRVIGLPTGIDADKITAKFENGVLDMNIPKMPENTKTKISIE